jgi:hypothetical protein
MSNIGSVAGDQIVDGNHTVAFREQPIAQVRS